MAGFDDDTVRVIALMWFGLSAIVSVVLVVNGTSGNLFFLVFLGLTLFQLSVVVVSEVAECLLNPTEGTVLAPLPVNDTTWLAARLTHLVGLVVYVVVGVNTVPALVGAVVMRSGVVERIIYAALHLGLALGLGLGAAAGLCGLFGWLVRLVPLQRLRGVGVAMQGAPLVGLFGARHVGDIGRWAAERLEAMPVPGWWATVAEAVPGGSGTIVWGMAVGLSVPAVVLGLRTLSQGYVNRMARIVTAGRARRGRTGRGGRVVARITGGQAGRAGYEYFCMMVTRDWQFRRTVAMHGAGLVVMFIYLLVAGRRVSPFEEDGVAPMQLLPHLFGMASLVTCLFLKYGDGARATWVFRLVPGSSYGPFARGLHAGLWLVLVGVPALLWWAVLAWSWGWQDATLFMAFCVAVASVYSGLSLRLVGGLPFTMLSQSGGLVLGAGATMMFVVGVAVAVAVQQLVVFRTVGAVVGVTIVTSIGAMLSTRMMLRGLAGRMAASAGAAEHGLLFGWVQGRF